MEEGREEEVIEEEEVKEGGEDSKIKMWRKKVIVRRRWKLKM